MDCHKMSLQQGRVVSQILLRHFGEIVQKVGDDIFACGKKSIALIVRTTELPRSQVTNMIITFVTY